MTKLQSIQLAARRHAIRLSAFAAAAVPMLASAQAVVDPFAAVQADVISKVGTYGGGLVLVAAAGVVLAVAAKYVKKIKGAA